MIRFSATNLSKESVDLSDTKQFTVSLDYNDGFIFSTADRDVSTFESENGEIAIRADGGKANSIKLSPLTSKEYTLHLTCPKVVRDQTDKPLTIIFTIGKDGSEKYEFKIH